MVKKEKAAKQTASRKKIILAAFLLAEKDGWANLSMADISDKASLTHQDVISEFPNKIGLLWGILDSIDKDILMDPSDSDGSTKERLFEIIMSRFDALNANKAAIKSIARGLTRDPLTSLLTLPRFMLSMSWILEAAGISSAGFKGLLKTKGLAILYLNTTRVWLSDDTPDMSKTMVILDQNLHRAERLVSLSNVNR